MRFWCNIRGREATVGSILELRLSTEKGLRVAPWDQIDLVMHEEKQILREALTYCVGSVVDPLDLEKAPSLGIYTPRHTDTSYTHRMTFFFFHSRSYDRAVCPLFLIFLTQMKECLRSVLCVSNPFIHSPLNTSRYVSPAVS